MVSGEITSTLVDDASANPGPALLPGFTKERGPETEKNVTSANLKTEMNTLGTHVVGDTRIHEGKAKSTVSGPGEVLIVASNVKAHTDLGLKA